MSAKYRNHASALALIVLVGGCATPAPVLDLASQGVAVTGKTEAELDEFVSRSHRIYTQRLQSVKRLAMGNIEANAKTEFENYTAKRAEMTAEANLVTLIRELSDYRVQLRENALKQQAELEKKLAVDSAPAKLPREKILELKNAFAELSAEISREEWLGFLIGFGQLVNESRKESKDSAKNAEDKATKLDESLKESEKAPKDSK